MDTVPIKAAAAEELCKAHEIPTFTGWEPPSRVDLIIAVSFGLFVPPRILGLARYGGLNLHPSLLPDLKGPAPIQHALLKGRKYTGVSVQTLHPSQFDGGLVLAQTPSPGIAIPNGIDGKSLTEMLGDLGADMLVDILKTKAFVPPLKDVGWYKDSDGPIEHAPKISAPHLEVTSETTMEQVFVIKRAIGNPWFNLPTGDRLILNEFKVSTHAFDDELCNGRVGKLTYNRFGLNKDVPLVQMACGGVIEIEKCTWSGGAVGHGNQKLVRLLKSSSIHNK